MSDDIEKILSTQPDAFERVMYRIEEWLTLLEERIQYSAQVSATLDASYDLLVAALARAQDIDDDDARGTASTAKARALVKQFRGCRDAGTGKLLTHIVGELHALHAIHKGRVP